MVCPLHGGQADLRGVYSHGVNRLDLYCDELRRGAVDASATPVVVSDAAGIALVDGNNAQGPGKAPHQQQQRQQQQCHRHQQSSSNALTPLPSAGLPSHLA